MHHHCEIIMPPTNDPVSVANTVLEPFSEHIENNHSAFWDWHQIGGRWSGAKAKHRLDKDRLDEFMDHLIELKITVSPVSMGKQTLSPASQEPIVDSLWREWFPDSGLKQCPLFTHAGEQLAGDICTLAECPKGLSAARIIVAVWRAPNEYRHVGTHVAHTMITNEVWNGVNFEYPKLECTIENALSVHQQSLTHIREDLRRQYTPDDDWLVVTVDYHS